MLPSALDHVEEIAGKDGRDLAIFLDYDGTLTPIVTDPENALLSDSMKQTLRALVRHVPVSILSGRDLDDVRRRVDIDGIIYAGSHGFDIAGPGDLRKEVATEFLAKLDLAERKLREKLAEIVGALVERKRFSIATHYRLVKESDFPRLERVVRDVAAQHRELRGMDGKKVYEMQPDIDWDKGKAVLWLLQTFDLKHANVLPMYIGDDRTDEDAFRAIGKSGIAILVSEQPRVTAASYLLKDPMEVQQFLRGLVACLDQRRNSTQG
ncbi:MAG TPA: trehalose-phosphatase [Candidatus Udaeobacter sp.]|nr:trehalose-phosphatase [Candidatus Udaeobacter sp.]